MYFAYEQILELSGIGLRDVLEKAGIEVKVDLPGVGENVQEHLWSGIICRRVHHCLEYVVMKSDRLQWSRTVSSMVGR